MKSSVQDLYGGKRAVVYATGLPGYISELNQQKTERRTIQQSTNAKQSRKNKTIKQTRKNHRKKQNHKKKDKT